MDFFRLKIFHMRAKLCRLTVQECRPSAYHSFSGPAVFNRTAERNITEPILLDGFLAAAAAGLYRRRTPSRFWWLSSRLLLGLHALEGVLLHRDGGRRPVGFTFPIRLLRLFNATLLPSSRESGNRISAGLARSTSLMRPIPTVSCCCR